MRKIIQYSFYTLAFLLPLTFYVKTSELFEFNKMILVYFSTIVITALWVADWIMHKKIVFRKTLLNYPILIFLALMFLSTIVSIDFRTSLLGYYSRFHGGLVSYICYSLLYWAFVNNFDKKSVILFIKVLISSTVIASIYAGFEHFGHSVSCVFVTGNFDVNCWVQDVQDRIFGTFGQPNWLAAWLVAVLPISLFIAIDSRLRGNDIRKSALYLLIFCLISVALYYTKSRSGFIALIISYLIFWSSAFYLNKNNIKKIINMFLLTTGFLLYITFFIKTPWQPQVATASAQEYVAPALEGGGTESGNIRRIVWKGAWDLFKKYPVLGTGLDTFAFSYYETRPMEHNMTSEWNFVYNRAHNEYLNFLATTGVLGTLSYLFLIFTTIFILLKRFNLLNSALLSSYTSILITNFFGFSTVAVGFLFFMIPAISIAYNFKPKKQSLELKLNNLDNNQKTILLALSIFAMFFVYLLINYFRADLAYAEGKRLSRSGNYAVAVKKMEQAIELNRSEATFYNELSQNNLFLNDVIQADVNADKALDLSPHNVAIHKQVANTYSKLSAVDAKYALKELEILEKLLVLAPTDPSVQYKYASFLARTGNVEQSIEELKKTIKMKPDYKIAHILLAYIYEDTGEIELARQQYEYILTHVDPNDEKIKEDLEGLDSD